MLKVVTASKMHEIDHKTINEYGISETVLMERAGLAVASKINELFFQNIVRRASCCAVEETMAVTGLLSQGFLTIKVGM